MKIPNVVIASESVGYSEINRRPCYYLFSRDRNYIGTCVFAGTPVWPVRVVGTREHTPLGWGWRPPWLGSPKKKPFKAHPNNGTWFSGYDVNRHVCVTRTLDFFFYRWTRLFLNRKRRVDRSRRDGIYTMNLRARIRKTVITPRKSRRLTTVNGAAPRYGPARPNGSFTGPRGREAFVLGREKICFSTSPVARRCAVARATRRRRKTYFFL